MFRLDILLVVSKHLRHSSSLLVLDEDGITGLGVSLWGAPFCRINRLPLSRLLHVFFVPISLSIVHVLPRILIRVINERTIVASSCFSLNFRFPSVYYLLPDPSEIQKLTCTRAPPLRAILSVAPRYAHTDKMKVT